MSEWSLEHDGFCLLKRAIDQSVIVELIGTMGNAFSQESNSVRAKSDRGNVYAVRNVTELVPAVRTIWKTPTLCEFLSTHLGDRCGLVRVLFFDKPPEQSWNLGWHKDKAIAVKDNRLASAFVSRPSLKAGVPHLIAGDEILLRMLTLRIHLDEVTDENGPLMVVPGSHLSRTCEGEGTENAVTIYADPGDILAMRPLVSHASDRSTEGTKRHRRVLHLEFAADPSLPDGIEWNEFHPMRNPAPVS
ncbi:MAG: phytanoyl-CoA dioxygenase family protein [Planctomycetota bacterium]